MANDIAPSLQSALDDWDRCLPLLQSRYAELNKGIDGAQAVNISDFLAPLPRAYEWIDGSAYINHIVLVRKARNAEPPATLRTVPLVVGFPYEFPLSPSFLSLDPCCALPLLIDQIYQGGSGTFLGPTADISHFSEDYGIDFESEIGVILGDVPMGTTKEQAGQHIKVHRKHNQWY